MGYYIHRGDDLTWSVEREPMDEDVFAVDYGKELDAELAIQSEINDIRKLLNRAARKSRKFTDAY